ncbi:Inner membrane protein YbhL [Candidatus Hartigia pinicola]|nr:Inner membrane protein YbhL [Candidatus Hartigia pinicola]
MDRFDQRNDSLVRNSSSVQIFMSQVYGWMTAGLLLTACVAWYTLNLLLSGKIFLSQSISIGLLVAQISVVLGLSFLLPKISGAVATGMFMFYSMLTGVTFSMILAMYTQESVVGTFIITAVMFSALSFYGYTTKRSLNNISSFLFMGLIGLIITSLVNIWMQSSAMYWIITCSGVLIFSGLTAYDTQKLIKMGAQINIADKDNMRKFSILGALNLYLDFINVFLMLIRIFSNRR